MISFNADLTGLNLKSQTDRDTGEIHRTAIPHLQVKVNREQLERLFGETTGELAFGSMRADGTLPYKQVKPSIVHGVHDVVISGAKFRGAPVVMKIEPADEIRHVAVHIEIPFSRDTYRAESEALADLLGEPGLAVDMEVVQRDLPGTR